MDTNIVKNYDWTSIPRGSELRDKAPRVSVTEYKIETSQALNRLKSYVNVVKNVDADKFYEDLYKVKRVRMWRFPFLGDAIRSFSNDFGDTFQSSFLGAIDSFFSEAGKLYGQAMTFNPKENVANFTKQFGGGISSAASNAVGGDFGKAGTDLANSISTSGYSTSPGSYIETPKMYEYTQNDAPLEVSFVLSNTINPDSIDKNAALIEELQKINRPTRKTSLIMEPPRIYEVKLDGVRYMRWASCSSVNINFLGAKKIINNKIIPEGYIINLSFTSLTTEVSNFMDKI